jgi:hypothetical protein
MDNLIAVPEERRYVSVEDLTVNRASAREEDYELAGVGWIRIRGLSRAEFIEGQRRFPDDMGAQERFILSRTVVIPRVTEAVAGKWQESSGIDEINRLALHINKMSGLIKGADKSGLPGA